MENGSRVSSMSSGGGSSLMYRQRLKERETEVALLQERVNSLSAQLQTALSSSIYAPPAPSSSLPVSCGGSGGGGAPGSGKKRRAAIPLNPHAMNVSEQYDDDDQNTKWIAAQRERLGRNASIATQRVLDGLEQHPEHAGAMPPPIARILEMFQHPARHVDYLNSATFAKDLYKVTMRVRTLLEREPRVVFLQSPAYVFGDIHGNLEDLHFFSDNLWRLGMSLAAGNFLFLGDYVDRGLQCLECVAYLFALKLQNPRKVHLLRGNHETRDVNGWEEHYGQRSFIYQCRSRFGDDVGYRLWEVCNQAFDRLPLAAVIDNDIFCVHGGIPRPISPAATTRIQDILTVPKVAGINPPYEHEDDKYQQVASDCIWSDPASEEQEMTTVDPTTGYGESLRGGGAICFGNKAVTQFLQQLDYSYIMRAHEAHAEGVAVAKEARVFTVFSTSKDHNQGSQAMAGCILVDCTKLQVINRSPAYKNQYVHRRDSVSLRNVSESDIQKRIQLGLVLAAHPEPEEATAEESDEVFEETWENFNDTDSSDDERCLINNNNNNNNSNNNDNAENGGIGGGGAKSTTGSSNGSHHYHSTTTTAGLRNGSLEVDSDYVLTTTRRSSVDLSSMTTPTNNNMSAENAASSGAVGSAPEWENLQHHQHRNGFGNSSFFVGSAVGTITAVTPSTLLSQSMKRSKGPGFAPIHETPNTPASDDDDNNDDIDTVDGAESDHVME